MVFNKLDPTPNSANEVKAGMVFPSQFSWLRYMIITKAFGVKRTERCILTLIHHSHTPKTGEYIQFDIPVVNNKKTLKQYGLIHNEFPVNATNLHQLFFCLLNISPPSTLMVRSLPQLINCRDSWLCTGTVHYLFRCESKVSMHISVMPAEANIAISHSTMQLHRV